MKHIGGQQVATMSQQNLDYEIIGSNVEKKVSRQKWNYRIIFFLAHVFIYIVTMLAVWGIVLNDLQLRTILFNSGTAKELIVILPTILWATVIVLHVASLFFESRAGEQTIRKQALIREVGEDILRKGLLDEGMLEKPKRRAVKFAERVFISDDGEFMAASDDEHIERRDYKAHSTHGSNS
jgi:hypothetical protein